MRRSLARHLQQVKPKITKVIATHAHEEHVGNLNWLSEVTGAPVYVSEMTARFLTPFKKLPWVRATIIGQPPNLKQPYHLLAETIETESGCLQVIAAPGHCDDHIVLYDPKEKVLLAGDAFMGSYFATPNPDVDSRKWLLSLERLMELDVEILVEGHGHIHTLRSDIPDCPGVVIREDPKVAIAQKLDYMRWLRAQIEAGFKSSFRCVLSRQAVSHGEAALRGKVAPLTNASGSSALATFPALNWFAALFGRMATSFQPSTKCEYQEESDILTSQRNERDRA
jgi:glyoxylase-like metal-dependent hydrolase (beta-lactamase superfamily II)